MAQTVAVVIANLPDAESKSEMTKIAAQAVVRIMQLEGGNNGS